MGFPLSTAADPSPIPGCQVLPDPNPLCNDRHPRQLARNSFPGFCTLFPSLQNELIQCRGCENSTRDYFEFNDRLWIPFPSNWRCRRQPNKTGRGAKRENPLAPPQRSILRLLDGERMNEIRDFSKGELKRALKSYHQWRSLYMTYPRYRQIFRK